MPQVAPVPGQILELTELKTYRDRKAENERKADKYSWN